MKQLFSIIFMTFLSLGAVGQTFISVTDLLGMRTSFIKKNNHWQNIVSSRGYNKSRTIEDELYIYKNCRLSFVDDGSDFTNGQVVEADNKNPNASIVNIYKDVFNWYEYLHIFVIVYGKSNGQKWITQLSSLGYRKNNNISSSGYWYYEKKGSPDITLTCEGMTYRLETMIKGDYVME